MNQVANLPIFGSDGLNVGNFLDGTLDVYTRFKELELQRELVDLKAEQARLDLATAHKNQAQQLSTPSKAKQVNASPEQAIAQNLNIAGYQVNKYLLGGALFAGAVALALAVKG